MDDRHADIRRWAAGMRAAEKRAARARMVPSPNEAWLRSIQLWELAPDLFDDPVTIRLREEEVKQAREAWATLHRRWHEQRQAET